jgi:hypothetical protein
MIGRLEYQKNQKDRKKSERRSKGQNDRNVSPATLNYLMSLKQNIRHLNTDGPISAKAQELATQAEEARNR